jgi:antitoxin HicB
MAEHGYATLVRKISDAEGGGYLAAAPELDGCIADGDTPEAAMADLACAIDEWIDEAKRLGRPVPTPDPSNQDLHSDVPGAFAAVTRRTWPKAG